MEDVEAVLYPAFLTIFMWDWSHWALSGVASQLILVVCLVGFFGGFCGVFFCTLLTSQMLLYLYPGLSVQSFSLTEISSVWS